mmetsp:Transcript_100623/g.290644  ORF Transcript_100623/g.290644 Transcript_100623/m.290644 type:complete len:314 (+) Transcript_100623:609-1550(+)
MGQHPTCAGAGPLRGVAVTMPVAVRYDGTRPTPAAPPPKREGRGSRRRFHDGSSSETMLKWMRKAMCLLHCCRRNLEHHGGLRRRREAALARDTRMPHVEVVVTFWGLRRAAPACRHRDQRQDAQSQGEANCSEHLPQAEAATRRSRCAHARTAALRALPFHNDDRRRLQNEGDLLPHQPSGAEQDVGAVVCCYAHAPQCRASFDQVICRCPRHMGDAAGCGLEEERQRGEHENRVGHIGQHKAVVRVFGPLAVRALAVPLQAVEQRRRHELWKPHIGLGAGDDGASTKRRRISREAHSGRLQALREDHKLAA